MPWLSETNAEQELRDTDARLAGLETAAKLMAADALQLTQARRLLDIRWGEVLGEAVVGANQHSQGSLAVNRSQLDKSVRSRLRALAAEKDLVLAAINNATDSAEISRAACLRLVDSAKASRADAARAERRQQINGEEAARPVSAPTTFSAGDCRTLLTDADCPIADGSVQLLLTDPPYGVAWKTPRDDAAGRPEAAISLFEQLLAAAIPKLADDAHVLIFCCWRTEPLFRAALEEAGLHLRGSLVWSKESHGVGDCHSSFSPSHERILHATLGSPRLRRRPRDVITVPRKHLADRHPTEKPVELLRQLIEATTAPDDLILDPFAGVASSLVAAQELGRRSWGCELDEGYHRTGSARLS
jgi:adenine-specific DNA-methyltransferase